MMYANAFREHCGIFIDEFGQIVLDLPHWRNQDFVHRYFVPENCPRTFSCRTDDSPTTTRCDGDADADDGLVPDKAVGATVDHSINVSGAGGEDKRTHCCDSATQTELFGVTSLFYFVPDASVIENVESSGPACSSLWFDSDSIGNALGN